ncbi:hypothetical protein ACHQM5_029553 [Ranunculus cassubicifolius]
MCGRARCTVRANDISRAIGINNGGFTSTIQMDRYQPRYNVAPGSYMPVVRRGDGSDGGQGNVLHCMKWGLVPSFTKKTDKPDHYRMFNARSESLCEKASFRRLIPNNRCLVTVEGFYEWKKDGSKKQPYYIHLKNGEPLVFAALYDSWSNSEGEVMYTFTIITTSCSSSLQWLHDRMPVILGNKSSIDEWLNGPPSSKFTTLLKPYEDSDLAWHPVTPAMGKPSFDGPECINEIPLKSEEKNLISNFFSKKKELGMEQESNPFIKGESLEGGETKTSKYEKSTIDEEEKCGIKRDYDQLSSDLKPFSENPKKLSLSPVKKEEKSENSSDDELTSEVKPYAENAKKARMSPMNKKGKGKKVGGKQQSLLSFFGKSGR